MGYIGQRVCEIVYAFRMNVIVNTAHMAWASIEAGTRLVNVAASNYKAFINGRSENVVNS